MPNSAAALREDPPAFAPDTSSPPPIIMTPIKDLRLADEAPKGANLVVRNSGRGSPLTDAEMKASIYAKGIIQPLIFKLIEGVPYVIAGNRRLRFLREIFGAENSLPIQTQDVDAFAADWREIAIDTNLSLPPHLVERYEMLVAIAKDLKLSPEDTRMRFGMSTQQYNRVMALGKMAPEIRAVWKNGLIDAATAQVFTLEPDPKEQVKIYQSLTKGDNRAGAWEVRRRIVPATQQEIGKFISFIGLEDVRKAKLLKQEDMFADSHIVTDVKALHKMVGDRLAAICTKLIDDGWSWAVPEDKIEGNRWSYGTIDPAKKAQPTTVEKARLTEIERLLQADQDGDEVYDDEPLIDERDRINEDVKQRGYAPEQRQKAGCILKITRDGKLNIEYGRVKPSEKRSIAATERSNTKAKAAKPGEATLTNALAERLSEQLQTAGAEALKMDHAVATAAVIAAISSHGQILNIKVGSISGKSGSFSEVFFGALKATPQQREAMFAQIAAQALSIVVFNGAGKMPLDDEGLVDLFEAMNGGRVTKAIFDAFDAKDYFSSIGAGAIVEAVRCSMGDEHAAKVAKMKKPDAAKFAAANLKNYLPPQLRTEHYTGPVESAPAKAAEKAKKPKPVKKAVVKKKRK